MIWPFLFVLFFIVFTYGSMYQMAHSFLDYFMGTLFLGVLSALVSGFGIGFSSLVGLVVSKHWTGPETAQLVSLRDSEGISGHFFLGTGSIGTTQYYFFYKEMGQGYQPGKVAIADNVMIFEEKRQNGKLKAYTYEFVNPSFRWVAMDWRSKRYEFVIPEGSLKKNFVLQ